MKKELVDHYGNGTTNVDVKTGIIHYGVINQKEVLQVWADSSEPIYICGNCEHKPDSSGDVQYDECPDCEADGFQYEKEGYICTQDYDDMDIFILRSPFYTRCAYCSPCAPGAGDLMSPDNLGPKTYCFGDDWFESGKAPYPIFKVKKGKANLKEKERKI